MTREAINELIEAPNHEEDNYSILMDEEVDENELERKCQGDKEAIQEIGKNNQQLSFNVGALLLSWTPLFKLICSRLIATTHTLHVELDRAILLYTMIEKKKPDAGWIIFNILELVDP